MKQENTSIKTIISAMTHDARGIAQVNGKTVFIDGALPGEEVFFTYTKRRGKYDEGKLIDVIQPSSERVTPLCQHFAICGGCALQHMSSEGQLQFKQKLLLEQLHHFGGIKPDNLLLPLTGPSWGYRRKARLGAKYVIKKQKLLVGFREKNGRYLADLARCEVLDPKVGNLITPLQQLISQFKTYDDIPQIEVAIGDDETALVFRHMVPLPEHDKNLLIEFAKQYDIRIYLQPDKPDSIHNIWPENASALLNYHLPSYGLTLEFKPNDFTQVNAEINKKMVAQALALLQPTFSDRVLDLFCGLGNFTLPLAKVSGAVLGVEGDAELIKRAIANAKKNEVNNAEFYQADLTATLHLAPWAQTSFNKILLDPPRSGALEVIQNLHRFNAEHIVYVSCNPATLARDAGELIKQGYRLTHAGIMDMFPQTHHVEAMALFVKQ